MRKHQNIQKMFEKWGSKRGENKFVWLPEVHNILFVLKSDPNTFGNIWSNEKQQQKKVLIKIFGSFKTLNQLSINHETIKAIRTIKKP